MQDPRFKGSLAQFWRGVAVFWAAVHTNMWQQCDCMHGKRCNTCTQLTIDPMHMHIHIGRLMR